MNFWIFIVLPIFLLTIPTKDIFAQGGILSLHGRELLKRDNQYVQNIKEINWQAEKTAIIICDMWDQHWCNTATERVKLMAPKMNTIIKAAREKGVTIVHAPSSTMEYYRSYPQRVKMMEVKYDQSSNDIEDWYSLDQTKESALPIDDSDGGCDDPNSTCVNCAVWKKQIDLIEIYPEDCISDNGKEINNYFIAHDIKNVLLMGVHTNMCVLGRSFGIRSHINQGRNVLLVRDLTDAMYNPDMSPRVDHHQGTQMVINHIEKYWCPTINSEQIE